MTTTSNPSFKTQSERIEKLMQISGLELSGFAEFTGVSESHIYAIINGTKELTQRTAEKIAAPFEIKGTQLMNSNFKLTQKLNKTLLLTKFYKENKGVHKYFINTRVDRKVAHFIEHEILTQKQFNRTFSVGEVRQACLEEGKKYTSKRVSQVLNYLVETNNLKSKKKQIAKKDGTLGVRVVDVFWKVKK
jgi:plasmid maintenance system antidote protein VapI